MSSQRAAMRPEGAPLFDASERLQIGAALALSTMTLFGIALMFRTDPRLATTLLSTIGMHATGARAPAIIFCLSRGMPAWATLLFNFYVEVLIVFLCYYGFVLVMREGFETRLLRLAAKKAEARAQTHYAVIKRYERIGLFFFVMAPFAMTGPVIGAIIGYLLNLKPWVTFSIVLSGTFCALGGYSLLGKAVILRMIAFRNEYQDFVTIAIAVIIAVFMVYHVTCIARWVNESLNGSDRPEAGIPGQRHDL